MDEYVKSISQLRIDRTIEALKKNNMNAYFVEHHEMLVQLLKDLIPEKSTVGIGGSMTLFETGTVDFLRSHDINFLDRYQPDLTPEDIKQIYRDSFSADIYMTSSNAVTESGNLYNVDGRGNRVAAMIYGPDKVIVVVGSNKIVRDDQAAILRNREIAAPANAKRLSRKTPCNHLGYCTDCDSPDRICANFVFMRKQMVKDRIHVLILDEQLGY
ncbi:MULTISPECIES: lactate utilization protein [unclassified Fusibacter]|uniref:lactate utilization protein n=1 Tax=unclassified Fusibacter TaxID=2624464 RepID=UPI0010119EC0|nr:MULTISPECIES: lactate utilization protein [unclassified Fusibacter]MCK8058647.1 lactate utilization protein [Fusibacter sp. A2]NPE21722.1 lactate utilization protein [Fusibacter sp. A1]RXV61296.1 lactate utilization protein [Fusibacter sp. A1]